MELSELQVSYSAQCWYNWGLWNGNTRQEVVMACLKHYPSNSRNSQNSLSPGRDSRIRIRSVKL